ncbi:hypothetical protein [Dictyobacter kobayashii]|uniref:Lipid/polyisoprenoid-binding YceI-like domain-containing protein n=1 Tax=Dictyobacter kobayashii TaxID=2014872 RepID=A0A402ANL0_9CHLR|nr:hypothetical protein [Dictyobacter kobayashii]GCE20560.1 hypothetical protein KDK_43600 [Dictyobacter kobayashii]
MALHYRKCLSICLLLLAIQLTLAGVFMLPGSAAHAQQKPPNPGFVLVTIPVKTFAATNVDFKLGTFGTGQKIPVFKTTFDIAIHNPFIVRALQPNAPANIKTLTLRGVKIDVADIRASVGTFQNLFASSNGPFGFDSKTSSLQLTNAVFQIPLLPAQVAILTKLKAALQQHLSNH